MQVSPRIAAVLVFAGIVVLVTGVTWLSVPWGLITAGASLIGLGLVVVDVKDTR